MVQRLARKGSNDARLDTLFLALPVSWKGTLIQHISHQHHLRHDKKAGL